MDNLEEKIIQCLDTPKDFSFAIDTEGHRYIGKRPEKYLNKPPGLTQKYMYEESARAIRLDSPSDEETGLLEEKKAASSL